ncbi:hypothetical protein Lepto7375DRAFT_2573 [Leptolyngbya sp. PCC 7375]|nr:hypothetical protein Lepto7375DRAFT_2573 [Leptolyngbya sp. PCC 7375]
MTSFDLGTLQAQRVIRNNRNVNIFQPTDVYEFDIVGNRQIGLYLHDLVGGDADLRLYRDTNRNGFLDHGDRLVASSIRGGTLSDTIDYAATTGTYFARVNRFSGTSISYDLDLAATYDIGRVNASPVSRNNYNVRLADPVDVYEFDIAGNRQIGLYLHDLNGGDADLRLYRDSNNNGVFDASDLQVASSVRGGTLSDTIDYAATTGTYFARVNRFSGTSISYDLDFSATYDVGQVNASPVSRNNYTVSAADPVDVYEFDISGSRQIGLYLHDLNGGDADLRLYRDSNNNGVFDASDLQVASSIRGGTLSDTIDYAATTGTYFARVNRFSGGTISYDLDLSATYDVGTVGTTPVSRNNYSLSIADPTDVFELDIVGTRNINLSLHDISFADDADLRLFRDSNGNGVFDASDVQVASSRRGGNRDDVINYRATGGTYFAQVERFALGSNGNVSYDLDISATPTRTPSNLLGSEVELGNLAGDRLLRGGVGNTDTTDTYSFSLGLFEGVNVRLNGLLNDADVRVIRDNNSNGIVDAGEVIGSSTRAGNASELISNITQSGNYFVQVYQYNGNTPYSLTMDHFNTPFA